MWLPHHHHHHHHYGPVSVGRRQEKRVRDEAREEKRRRRSAPAALLEQGQRLAQLLVVPHHHGLPPKHAHKVGDQRVVVAVHEDQILRQQHTDDVVAVAAVHGDPRVPAFEDFGEHAVAEAFVGVEHEDVARRGHHVLDVHVAELQRAFHDVHLLLVQRPPFFFLKTRRFFVRAAETNGNEKRMVSVHNDSTA
jgi:hypothetical protein